MPPTILNCGSRWIVYICMCQSTTLLSWLQYLFRQFSFCSSLEKSLLQNKLLLPLVVMSVITRLSSRVSLQDMSSLCADDLNIQCYRIHWPLQKSIYGSRLGSFVILLSVRIIPL